MANDFQDFNFGQRMGFQNPQQVAQQNQQQMASLKDRLNAMMLPMQNPAAFQPQAVQTLLQPGAAQPNYLQYGMGPEQMFFQPYYFQMPGQVNEARTLQDKIDKMKSQPRGLFGGGLLNMI